MISRRGLIFGTVALLQGMCTVDGIGLAEPSTIPIGEIVANLGKVRTQEQAEFAIDLLLAKTGIGSRVRGNAYAHYDLPDGINADIGETHIRTLRDPEFRLSWLEVFELEQILSEGEWMSPVTFNEMVSRFREQAASALQDPETPNHALLAAILSIDGELPRSVPVISGDETLLGVQDFLLTVWINAEFQLNEDALLKPPSQGTKQVDRVVITCELGKPEKIHDIFAVALSGSLSDNHAKCLAAGETMYKRLVKKVCLRKMSKMHCTDDILPCIVTANNFLDDWLNIVCDQYIIHDQGGR